MIWTENQLEAIEVNNKNILVAAAAGSGKTAVLVERIIQKILKQNVDIDKLLVVTFTNAAASEIRQRVLEAIYKKLEEEPENENLQKQIILLNKSNISTIHSFCLSVIKNNFFDVEISPDFRIGDSAELELLKLETLDEVFDELYEENNPEFIKLTEIYTGYRGDEKLKELVLKIYKFIQSSPFPEEWLSENINKFDLSTKLSDDFSETEWGKIILEEIRENIERNIVELKSLLVELGKDEDLKKCYNTITSDIAEYERHLGSLDSWDLAYNTLNTLDFQRWSGARNVESEIQDKAKKIRTSLNTSYKELIKKLIVADSENANKDIFEMYSVLQYLEKTVLRFMEAFKNKKQNKNMIDFNDIEHYALQILVKKDAETNSYIPTAVATSYRDKFQEIAIDEYQDSNSVQECILSAISNGHNMFMVGDVKQSIYRFRQARPELFLEKYDRFEFGGELNRKIQLFKNFRSRELVLEFANIVFENIMTRKVGNIDYTEEEYLNFAASFEKPELEDINYAGKMSFEIIDTKNLEVSSPENDESEYNEDGENEENDKDSDVEEIQENLEKIEIEARYVAHRIQEIIKSEYNVFDKELKKYRPVTYKDFVILLRSASSVAPIFEKEIFKLNMPVFSDSSQEYLESIEVDTILSLLKIIDNPMQDIALVSVLRSYIGDFDDNQLLEIRLNNIKSSFYESMISYTNSEGTEGTSNLELKSKIDNFLTKLDEWQEIVKYIPLDEFLWKIYIETGYYNYVSMMKDGALKVANLKMLFERAKQYEKASFKGIYNFIKFIEKLKKNDTELENAKLIGENDNVIRIMSIHKSKGLEFPIVFLSTVGKRFNLRDLNDNILLHQDLGIGPKYVNFERKIEYSTLAREALKIKLRNDSLSEEMRVLYVALTRPKERLIITGAMKDAKKKFLEKKALLEVSSDKGVNSSLLKKHTSYLDWLELAYLNDFEKIDKSVDFNILDINDIVAKYKAFNSETEDTNKDIKEFLKEYKFSEDEYQKIENLLSFKYKKQELATIQSKMSVTMLKNLSKDDVKYSSENRITLTNPKFINAERVAFTKAEIGTIMHLVFQKVDFNKNYTLELLKEELDKYVECEILTLEQRSVIDVEKIYKFVTSDFAQRIKTAKNIYTEAPFYMNVSVSEISNNEKLTDFTEKVLVQGIIDLYFEEADGKIVLLDYKTDHIELGQEQVLIDRHKEQLAIYKKALENATKKEVKEVYIYSICLDKAICVEV